MQNAQMSNLIFRFMRNIHNLYIDLGDFKMYNRLKDTVNLKKLALFIFFISLGGTYEEKQPCQAFCDHDRSG